MLITIVNYINNISLGRIAIKRYIIAIIIVMENEMKCVNFFYQLTYIGKISSHEDDSIRNDKSNYEIDIKIITNNNRQELSVSSKIFYRNNRNGWNCYITSVSYYYLKGLKEGMKISSIGHVILTELCYQHLSRQYSFPNLYIQNLDGSLFTVPNMCTLYNYIKDKF